MVRLVIAWVFFQSPNHPVPKSLNQGWSYSLQVDFSFRRRRLRELITDARLDLLLLTHPPNIRYLCGFSGSSGVLAISAADAVFFTDGRYTEQAREEVADVRIVIGKAASLPAAAKWASAHGFRSIGIESDNLTVTSRSLLKRGLPDNCRLRDTQGIVEQLRVTKDEDELCLIRAAADLGASLLDVALATIRPGIAESEVAAEMEYAARRRGAEAMSFETIIAAGPRSALPHGRATSALIPRHGFVVLDFGCILLGYCSDMTRTVGVGKVSRSDRDLYEAVREAQQAAVDSVRPGVTCGDVDRAARSVLRKARLDRFFTHSTGHGVGLEIHEQPRIARGQRELLRPGMVITIEPGVYLPGRGGVRIEDMVAVREGGCEMLTPSAKSWIEL
jgi:Xaa-Pro aminopeptidase